MEYPLGLPPEILALVFTSLNNSELAACSGVHYSWHCAAKWEMERRDATLYRWPHPPPKSVRKSLCIAGGIESVRGAARLSQGVENMEIYLDEPHNDQVTSMMLTIHPSLKRLTIKNAIINEAFVRQLLDSNIQCLKICINRKRDFSRNSRRLLLDHKELFEELVISLGNPIRSFAGVYPNPSIPVTLDNLIGRRAILDAAGLKCINTYSNQILSLTIANATQLTDEELLEISRLPLKDFSISDCKASSVAFTRSFADGFHSLESLTILNVWNVDLDCIRHISHKSNLKNLCLDLRGFQEVDQCFNLLTKLCNLRTLIILYCSTCNFENVYMLNVNCRFLRKIVLKNFKYCDKSESTYPTFREKCNILQTNFEYISERTWERCILHKKKKTDCL